MAFSGNTDSFYDPANSYVDEVRSVGPCRCLIRLHPPVFMARDPAFHRRPSSPQLSRSDAQVIASRKGIPISLSVIYSAVAARGSLRLHGALDRSSLCPQCTPACAGVYSHSSWCAEAANFPNQFLVRFIRWVLNSYRRAIAQSFVAFSVRSSRWRYRRIRAIVMPRHRQPRSTATGAACTEITRSRRALRCSVASARSFRFRCCRP